MNSRSIAACGLALSLAAACGKSDNSKQQTAAPTKPADHGTSAEPVAPSQAPAPSQPEAAEEIDPDSIAWTEHTLERVGISVPTMDGVDVRANTMNSNSYIRQMKKPVNMAFWVGNGRSVANWRRRYENNKRFTLSKPEVVQICGVTGTRQTLSMPGGRMQVGGGLAQNLPTEAAIGDGTTPAETETSAKELPKKPVWKKTPATTTTVLGFERRGVPVIASWTVETERRSAFKAAEDAYFAGITCVN